MGSKVIGFRVPDDLAKDFEQYCEGADKTSGEVLRKLVDDLIYPGSGRVELEDRSEDLEAKLAPLESMQEVMAQQIKDFGERLELISADRGMTEADRAHYDKSLASLGSELANLKIGVNKLVRVVNENVEAYDVIYRTVNKNVDLCNESFDRLSRLFQILEAHGHDGSGKVEIAMGADALLANEVRLADKRIGELPITVRHGKVDKPGWKYLEATKKSVKD